MPRLLIHGFPVISYDFSPRDKFWTSLSKFLIKKYTDKFYKENEQVESILLDSFAFLINEFKKILAKEDSFKFFLYVFWLHEESIKLYMETLGNKELYEIDESEFAMYRRILKLILEQGCDNNLIWSKFPDNEEIKEMDDTIQNLLYLGTWIFGFADMIAFQKMVDECHKIEFDDNGLLKINWQYHYGEVYEEFFPLLGEVYKAATMDKEGGKELISTIEECFQIEYNWASGIIFEIKRHHSPENPDLKTIEASVLPINLSHRFGIPIESSRRFYQGLTISKDNKLSIEEAVLKPYSTQRYLFRPILIYQIGGKERALVGIEKIAESIMVLATNAMHWNAMLAEWLENHCIQSYVSKKGDEHDKILEDEIENVIKSRNLHYCRNIKSFKQSIGDNIKINNSVAGEIDFLIINPVIKRIFVVEVKYNRARYEAIGFRNDNSNFVNLYEPKLQKKTKWISKNLEVLQDHLRVIYRQTDINILDFQVEGVFFINTPTFYMFNGQFKAITLNHVSDYLDGRYPYPILHILLSEDDEENYVEVMHPYFQKPPIG